jgi:hypothetical protein
MNEEGDVDLLLKYSMNNDLIDHSASTDKQQKSLLTLTDPVKIMKWAENNPIVSAFGIWNSNNGRFNNGSKNLERLSMMQKIGGVFPVHGGGESGSGVVNYDHDDKTDGAHHRRSFLHSSSSMSSSLPPTTTSTTDLNITQQRRCDRSGNISMVGAVMTATTTTQTMTPTATMRNNSNDGGSSNSSTSSGITQQHLSSYQQRLQQQQRQQQRKRESSNSNRCVSPLPPLPPQHATRMIQSPPPLPPGSKLLMGGGMSGFGGVSSPRRKIPLPSDLPNSTTTTDVAMAATSSPSNNANTTSYDANYYHLDDNHHHQNQYNRRNSTSSAPSFSSQQSPPTLATRQHQQQQQHRYSKPAIEWDIFLDPQLVRHVDAALTIVDDLECNIRNIRITREQNRQMKRRQREDEHQRYLKQLEVMKCCRMNGGGFGSGAGVRGVGGVGGVMTDSTTSLEGGSNYDDDDDDDEIYDDEEDFDLLQSHTAAQVEVDRLVSQLMRRTIIAHGSMSQLVLEGLGWAPEYNFGRVVRCSREGTNLPSPQRRNGHHHCSSISNNTYYSNKNYSTFSWDEEEEQRDFEALLDRRLVGSVGGGGGGSATGNTTGATDAGKGSNSTHYSRGMFMEKWLSLFAKSLTLLELSTTNTNSSFGGGSNDIVKLSSSSSSSSSNSRRKKKNDDNALLLLQKKNKKSVTKKPVDEGGGGLTNYFRSFFFSPEKRSSSIGIVEEDFDSDDIIDQEKGAKNNDDDASCYLTNNDMFSPATATTSTGFLGRFSCGLSLCLVGVDDTCGPSTCQTSNNYSVFPHNPHASHQMARDIQQIHDVLGEPLRLVLDLKSRRVPPRVWSRLIDNLRSRGLIVEGVGSFDMDELRTIGKGCSYPLTPILFFHSVGDLQHACHANEIKRGDTVYFNGGSLMWKRSSIMEAAECEGCCGAFKLNRDNDDDDDNDIKPRAYDRSSSTATAATMSSRTLNANGKYSFQPYAYPRSALSDWERVMCKSTIEDYRRYFHLKIGVYVQGETIPISCWFLRHNEPA